MHKKGQNPNEKPEKWRKNAKTGKRSDLPKAKIKAKESQYGQIIVEKKAKMAEN